MGFWARSFSLQELLADRQHAGVAGHAVLSDKQSRFAVSYGHDEVDLMQSYCSGEAGLTKSRQAFHLAHNGLEESLCRRIDRSRRSGLCRRRRSTQSLRVKDISSWPRGRHGCDRGEVGVLADDVIGRQSFQRGLRGTSAMVSGTVMAIHATAPDTGGPARAGGNLRPDLSRADGLSGASIPPISTRVPSISVGSGFKPAVLTLVASPSRIARPWFRAQGCAGSQAEAIDRAVR